MRGTILLWLCAACSSNARMVESTTGGGGGMDLSGVFDLVPPSLPDVCVTDPKSCYTVYAHGDHILYKIDLAAKTLVTVGPFNAPKIGGSEDVITDLAVSPGDVIYAISNTQLYTASATDGHVTVVGPVAACGMQAVAMTFGPDGTLYAGDYKGQFCTIDLATNPPKVVPVAKLSGGLALAGDLVAVGNGTIYGTAYRLSDASTMDNNLLVTINPASAAATVIGSTGSKNLYGVSYALGQVFGFTHDKSGDVVTINPATGKGTLYNSFMDPSTGMGISFAGAGVNSMVNPNPG
jgi:hypothetical protein